jgi:glycosyltransferase involved in cell wall biosynthesis
LFDEAERLGILNPDVINRTATQLLDHGNKAAATEVLLRSLRIWPGQEILEHMISVIKSKRPKIAFFWGGDGRTFLNPVIDFVRKRFEVRLFEGTTEQQIYDLMQWSDISWFEWCTDLAVLGSRHEKVCKTIVRLHRYEAYADWPKQVNWKNVDCLVTVGNSFVKNALIESVPQVKNLTSIVTIPNGVNLENINFVERQRGKNLACIGYLNMRKNPVFLLQCMQKLHYIDPEYKLFFAGTFQDAMLQQYFKHMIGQLRLREVIFLDGWQSDIQNWLQDKHYIISASIAESQGMGMLEGMAAGLKPVIHNFPGASEIYPSEFLFDIAEQFCEQILSQQYEPARYRTFVERNYAHQMQLQKINELLVGLEGDIDSQQKFAPATGLRQQSAPAKTNRLEGAVRHI